MSSKRSLHEPAVRGLLTGLIRSGKRYYRIIPETGFHMPVVARVELMKLHMSKATGSRLLREAVSAGLITEEKIGQESHGRATPKQVGAVVVANATDGDIDDDGDDIDESGSRTTSKLPLGLGDIPRGELNRYELVKTGSGFWGFFDREHDREVIISRDKGEVLETIYAMRRNARQSLS